MSHYDKESSPSENTQFQSKLLEELISRVLEQREEILMAFVAKYGDVDPADIEQVFGTDDRGNIIYYVRKRKGLNVSKN